MAIQSHVLVVDDEVLAAMALQSVLERRGFRVTTRILPSISSERCHLGDRK